MKNLIDMGIDSLGVVIPALCGYGIKYWIDYRKSKNDAFGNEISKKIDEEIIQQFQNSLEINLYKKIVISDVIKKNEVSAAWLSEIIENLYSKIKQDKILFNYLDEYFLYNLHELRQSLSENLSQKPKLDFLNKKYQYFSGSYFFLLNKIRKGKFLTPRSTQYRILNSMYPHKSSKAFRNSRFWKKEVGQVILLVVIVSILPFLFSLIGILSKTFVDLIYQFYSLLSSHQ
ncbi:hypothetical protein ACI1TR_05015 [Lactococcus garvieae]|uniref:hypothetical protein n=1 Tax=Lactococcus garvieae TaxID=1363 RepID=UPI0038533726